MVTQTLGLPDIELLDPAVIADPYGALANHRESSPVYYSKANKAWLLTGHREVSWGYTARELSSDRVRPVLQRAQGSTSPMGRVLAMIQDWMVVSDPPAHTRLRRYAAAAFKSQRIAHLEEHITDRVDSLIDGLLTGDDHDLIRTVAHPLPGSVIAELLGAPVADGDRFRDWSDELALVAFGTGGDARDDRHERALRGLEEMFTYFRDLVAQARKRSPDSMISALLAAPQAANIAPLDDDEILSMCALLLFAGHETTINSITNSMRALLEHPDQLAALRADESLVPSAVEELLRWEGPIKMVVRHVKAPVQINDIELAPGQRVYLMNVAANRDPAVFDEPDRLDIRRSPNPHLAFGRGIHACVGAQLARLEMRIALSRLIQRVPDMRIVSAGDWRPSLAARTMTHFEIGFADQGGAR